MPTRRSSIAVLGDGGWGTTLAIHLHRLGHRVRWWGAFPDYIDLLARRRQNPKYLPGVPIPRSLAITADLADAVDAAHLIVLAVPSQFLRRVVRQIPRASARRAILVNVAKGLEIGTLSRMSEIITQELGPTRLAVLSGPNIASEIARGYPASSVVASKQPTVAAAVQRAMMGGAVRIYTSRDVVGVELGGALKNPLAIAAGISDGLGFGANAKAALVTRGVVEMARLGVALGARESTFWGLSGLGDLITTCLAGRNHWLGEQIGQGKRLSDILKKLSMVIEGVDTTKAAVALARRHGIELPIIEQVSAVLFNGASPRTALKRLMTRPGKAESVDRSHRARS